MTIKLTTGEELRNEYFVETRVMGTLSTDAERVSLSKVVFTIQATRGLDEHLHGEDCLQITYETGRERTLHVYGDANNCEDATALVEHFDSKTQEEWFAEAATLAAEWASGDSYPVSLTDVDHRGLLVHGEDLIEIDA